MKLGISHQHNVPYSSCPAPQDLTRQSTNFLFTSRNKSFQTTRGKAQGKHEVSTNDNSNRVKILTKHCNLHTKKGKNNEADHNKIISHEPVQINKNNKNVVIPIPRKILGNISIYQTEVSK